MLTFLLPNTKTCESMLSSSFQMAAMANARCGNSSNPWNNQTVDICISISDILSTMSTEYQGGILLISLYKLICALTTHGWVQNFQPVSKIETQIFRGIYMYILYFSAQCAQCTLMSSSYILSYCIVSKDSGKSWRNIPLPSCQVWEVDLGALRMSSTYFRVSGCSMARMVSQTPTAFFWVCHSWSEIQGSAKQQSVMCLKVHLKQDTEVPHVLRKYWLLSVSKLSETTRSNYRYTMHWKTWHNTKTPRSWYQLATSS